MASELPIIARTPPAITSTSPRWASPGHFLALFFLGAVAPSSLSCPVWKIAVRRATMVDMRGCMETMLGRILGVIGAGSASLSVAACGGTVASNAATGSAGGESSGGASVSGSGGSSARAGGGGSAGISSASGGAFTSSGGTATSPGGTSTASGGGSNGLPSPLILENAQNLATVPQACIADAQAYYLWTLVCLPGAQAGVSCAEAYSADGAGSFYNCGLQTGASYVCGPLAVVDMPAGAPADACCYYLAGDCPIGRPFVVAGKARTAKSTEGGEWAERLEPRVDELDADTRRALCEVYLEDALTEHASVASFARFTLQCLSAGTPADIVAAAQRAGLEELQHAKIAFGLASAYGGRAFSPTGLDIERALEDSCDVVQIARSVAEEGCVAETVSALLVAAARDAARDPVVKEALTLIADQELEHALLAWRFLRWAIADGGNAVRQAVQEIFAHAEAYVGIGAVIDHRGDPKTMRAHGYLPPDERRAIARDALRRVVAPAARTLVSIGSGHSDEVIEATS